MHPIVRLVSYQIAFASFSASLGLICCRPRLWETEKAAERWLGDNPQNLLISIIRLWGVIHFFRPRGRRGKWSKALIRHGADPRTALAGVLGLAAEDVQVRETNPDY